MRVLYRPQHTAIIQNKTRYISLNITLNYVSLQPNNRFLLQYAESLLYSHKNNFLFPFLNKHPRYTELKTLNTQHG